MIRKSEKLMFGYFDQIDITILQLAFITLGIFCLVTGIMKILGL